MAETKPFVEYILPATNKKRLTLGNGFTLAKSSVLNV